MKNSIMFVLKSFELGGLEIVSSVLANKFVAEGHHVSIFAFGRAEHSIEERLDKRIHCYTLKEMKCTEENVYAMRAVMLEEKVNVVINQWGLPFVPIKVIRKATTGLDVKVVSVYHNNPSFNGRIASVRMEMDKTTNGLKRLALRLKWRLFREITAWGMRYNYNKSDLYLVLSPSFIDEFKKFTRIRQPEKLSVLTNPITIETGGYRYDAEKKQKEIIYVGRIDCQQKRVDRVINTWALLEKRFPDWRLTIIGDGEGRKDVEQKVHDLHLSNVCFEGFQPPKAYYERASILLLTSEYEGFGLVIVEGMSFGVVPVVYGSYSAVYDIIENGVDGSIVRPHSGIGFVAQNMAEALSMYLKNESLLHTAAEKAIEKSKDFSIDTIARQWKDVFVNKYDNGGVNSHISSVYMTKQKRKEIVYVGRIDYGQKRVHRIIDTWAILEKCYSDWKLIIVGDGKELKNLEQKVKDLKLNNVSFQGFQSPKEFYERASILLLASEYEGFPLVIAECMSFGVIPVVYASYPAVYDIITHMENGMIVQPVDDRFSTEEMAAQVKYLMDNPGRREEMARQAILTSNRDYSLNTIYESWMKVFEGLPKIE